MLTTYQSKRFTIFFDGTAKTIHGRFLDFGVSGRSQDVLDQAQTFRCSQLVLHHIYSKEINCNLIQSKVLIFNQFMHMTFLKHATFQSSACWNSQLRGWAQIPVRTQYSKIFVQLTHLGNSAMKIVQDETSLLGNQAARYSEPVTQHYMSRLRK